MRHIELKAIMRNNNKKNTRRMYYEKRFNYNFI